MEERGRTIEFERRGGERKPFHKPYNKAKTPPKPKMPNHVDDLLTRRGQSVVIVTQDSVHMGEAKLISADQFTVTVEKNDEEGRPWEVLIFKHDISTIAYAKQAAPTNV